MAKRDVKTEAPELRLDPEKIVERVDWTETFGAPGRVEIEIGIGKGRFLLAASAAHPDVHHLGIEWANKYLRIAEHRARRDGLENVRFVRVDASELMPAVPDTSVSAYYVFYPDPWPRKRHHKRRFLREDNAEQMARSLVPGSCLHVATDHADYWEAIEPLFDGHAAYERLPGQPLATARV